MKIGITGHQDLHNKETVIWLNKHISRELKNRSVDVAYSSLAIGADQLFAELVVSQKIPLTVVVPSDQYETTFEAVNLKNYLRLLASASAQIKLDFSAPSEQAFFSAGKKVAESCDLLFAVWDGKKAKGLGGTGDIIAYAKGINKSVLHFDLINKNVTLLT